MTNIPNLYVSSASNLILKLNSSFNLRKKQVKCRVKTQQAFKRLKQYLIDIENFNFNQFNNN